MKQSLVNNLIKKSKEKEESPFKKSIKRLQRAYTEGNEQMSEKVVSYCDGTMSELEKKLFEFRLRTEPILQKQMELYLENQE
jgi:hypothetical protein